MGIFGVFAAVLLTVAACGEVASSAASPAQKGRLAVQTGLVGSVVVGPVRAVGRIGHAASRPVEGAKVIVAQREDGPEVASAVTDDAGHYEMTLAPGSYWVTLETSVSYRLTKDVPKAVTVTQGQTTALDVLLDTGIR